MEQELQAINQQLSQVNTQINSLYHKDSFFARVLSPFGSYKKPRKEAVEHQLDKWLLFIFLVYVVLLVKFVTFKSLQNSLIFGIYSIMVSIYILSRFLLAYFYSPVDNADPNYIPTVTFVTPAKDEEDNIGKTLRAILNSNYPKGLFEIIAINDGSADNTLREMKIVQSVAEQMGIRLRVVNWKKNRGKRDGMAKGISLSQSEIVVFIDSDSFVQKDTLKHLVKYFADPSIAAVAGHADVYNKDTNMLTRMQCVRYFVAFKAYKSAEALFGSVTCCSGCCSAYRRSYLKEILPKWLNQEFLGVRCTYGDDRSLTNMLLQNYKAVYAEDAKSSTVVPDTWGKFFKQQMRWKKSWTRESILAARFMWKKNPLMSLSFYVGMILPLVAPLIVIRAILWIPLLRGILPINYILGLMLMSSLYGVYYYIHKRDSLWFYGIIFAWFYSIILVWQLPWAIVRLKDSRWGTR